MILSNQINYRVWQGHYRYNPALIPLFEFLTEEMVLPEIDFPAIEMVVRERRRQAQTPALLERLRQALIPCRHGAWLARRGVRDLSEIYSVDTGKLSRQDQLDLFLFPDDHILDLHGPRVVEGPVFADWRDGELAGVCVRNASTDLSFVADAKYTFSNFGWFLFGADSYRSDENIFIVEGVFDALAMRHFGLAAIAVGCCNPQPFQLACLFHKFKHLSICFDNDLHGHLGAYVASGLIKCPVYVPELKDISTHLETGTSLRLQEVSREELAGRVWAGAAEYNAMISEGGVPVRPLPYN